MLFSSLTFLFLFLPLLIILYFLLKNRNYRNFILLILSLLFYSWGEPKNIILMLVVVLIAYITGLLIDKYDGKSAKKKKIVFIIGVVLIVSSLIYFKYTNFIIDNINSILNLNISVKTIVLPIGISFYVFQTLSYVIDLYKKEIKVQKNIFLLILYVTLFPQLIAGPIVRYQTVEDELKNRKENFNEFIIGLRRFIIGLSKKVIISNNVAILADFVFDNINIYNSLFGSLMVWLGVIAYTLQIYYDFSGYSDMAIGLGHIFGFHFLENFNYPYIAKSVTDFWRRWHISLSSWFRDYIYIPLGGNRVKKKRWIFNLLVVWSLTGLWHGASWNFVLWGLYYFTLLIFEKLFLSKYLKKMPKFVTWLYTIIIVMIGWVIFRVNEFGDILVIITKMFNFSSSNLIALLSIDNVLLSYVFVLLGIIFMFPIYNKIDSKYSNKLWYEIILNILCIILFMICVVFLVSSTYNPFIYFRF